MKFKEKFLNLSLDDLKVNFSLAAICNEKAINFLRSRNKFPIGSIYNERDFADKMTPTTQNINFSLVVRFVSVSHQEKKAQKGRLNEN
jgi:hypothetical protein